MYLSLPIHPCICLPVCLPLNRSIDASIYMDTSPISAPVAAGTTIRDTVRVGLLPIFLHVRMYAGWEHDVGKKTTHRILNREQVNRLVQSYITSCADEETAPRYGDDEQLIFRDPQLVGLLDGGLWCFDSACELLCRVFEHLGLLVELAITHSLVNASFMSHASTFDHTRRCCRRHRRH